MIAGVVETRCLARLEVISQRRRCKHVVVLVWDVCEGLLSRPERPHVLAVCVPARTVRRGFSRRVPVPELEQVDEAVRLDPLEHKKMAVARWVLGPRVREDVQVASEEQQLVVVRVLEERFQIRERPVD
jgi:hypothetical protein